MLAGFLALSFFCTGVKPEPTAHFWICFIAFLLVAVAIVHITFAWKRFYRCPSCEIPVKSSLKHGGDVPFNPDVCPNCGVRLR